MKRINVLTLVLALVSLLLAACGDNTATTGPVSPPAAATTAAATTAAVATTVASTTAAPATTTSAATTSAVTTAATTTAVVTTSAATTSAATTTSAAATGAATGAAQYPMTLTDASGTTLTLNKMPERVVCFSEACLDAMAELGVLPIATRTFMYPVAINPALLGDKAKNIGQVPDNGDSINFEELARQKPDLVVSWSGDATLRDSIKAIAPLYIMGDAKDVASAESELKKLAAIFGRTAQADAAAKRLDDKLAAYKAKSPRDASVLVMANYTAGNQQYIATSQSALCTTLNEVAKCGLDAPPVFSGYAQPSLENILQLDPQVLIVISVLISPPNSYSDPIVAQQKQAKQDLLNNGIWKNLNAVKNGKVYEVDRTRWYATPGTLSIGFTLDDVMTKMYPTIFPKPLP